MILYLQYYHNFDHTGNHSSYFLKEVLSNLADMQELPDEDFPFRKQVLIFLIINMNV